MYSIKKISAYINTLNSRIKVSYYYLSIKDEEKKNETNGEKKTSSSKEKKKSVDFKSNYEESYVSKTR